MKLLSKTLLHPYQVRAANMLVQNSHFALWQDMGLGKTVTTATALADLFNTFEIARVLIIAPLRVANTVWQQEIKRWEHTEFMTCAICTGNEKSRLAALAQQADVTIINCENIPWLVDLVGKKWPFDTIVIDESSKFKSTKAMRWKALKKMLPYINRVIELTGTPSPNGLLDVYAQIYLLDKGQRLGRSMTAFKQCYFESADYFGYKVKPRQGADKTIQDKIKDITLAMKASDYLQLPDRIDLVHTVELPPTTIKQYKTFERESIATLESGDEIVALSAAAVANKLLQMANGAVYDQEGNIIDCHSAKIDALRDIIDDNPNENILVAYNYRHDKERLLSAFPQAVLLDKEGSQVDSWNAGKIKMLLAHPASSGMGLNLQKGGSLLVWFGLTWNLENYQQFNARLHRQGQSKPVRIVHIIADETIDNRVMSALASKAETQEALLQALKIV